MTSALRSFLAPKSGSWTEVATGIVLFVGALAFVGGLLGSPTTLLPRTMYYLGGAAVVVLGVSMGRSAFTWVTDRRPVVGDHDGATEADRPDNFPASREEPADSLELELYQAEGCPYCARVRNYCTRQGISLVIHNPRTAGTVFTGGSVTDPSRYDELLAYGKDQLPLLVDNQRDEVCYESDDIVAYLETHYA